MDIRMNQKLINKLFNAIASSNKTVAAEPPPSQGKACVVCPSLEQQNIPPYKEKTPLMARMITGSQNCGPGFISGFGNPTIQQSYIVYPATAPLIDQKLYATCHYNILNGQFVGSAVAFWATSQPPNSPFCLDGGESFNTTYCFKEAIPVQVTDAPTKVKKTQL